VVYADLATSTNFVIERGVIDTGGGEATSTSFRSRSSIGQPGTGISSSTSFILRGGFLYFAEGAPAVSTSVSTTTVPAPAPAPSAGTSGPYPIAGLRPHRAPTPEQINVCDFNADKRCNIIDLSIMLFYYQQTGRTIARYDLDSNGIVDFRDVSVLMFYWTG